MTTDTIDLTHLPGLSWEQWRDRLENYHEHLRATEPGFEGYGHRLIIADTGDDYWRQYWAEGYSPEEALAEDRTYWDDPNDD